MTDELVALLDGNEVGRVRNDARGRLTFVYDSKWRGTPGAYPLSLSMPLAAEKRGPTAVQTFQWGLLPDNERVLDRLAKKFQVPARNVFLSTTIRVRRIGISATRSRAFFHRTAGGGKNSSESMLIFCSLQSAGRRKLTVPYSVGRLDPSRTRAQPRLMR
jgi:HipA-like protein